MGVRRWLLALTLCAPLAACSDGTSPEAFEGIPVALSLHAPAGVSQQEMTALGSAFDRVDTYSVVVTDSINGSTVLSTSLPAAGPVSGAHELRIMLSQSTVGLAVQVTVVGLASSLELYRTSAYLRVQSTTSPTPLVLPLRYTGPGLRGRVVNAQGAVLGGVPVDLLQGASVIASVTTEADGTYLFLPPSEGGPLNPGTYQVRPQPTGQSVCPAVRSVTATTNSALVANFTAQSALCQVDLLVLSGGDVDDTQTVASLFANTPNVSTQTYFFVNQLPGLSFLNQFDAVLLFANGQFNESANLGSQVESYVQAGGNLVISTFYWQNRSDSNLGSTGWGRLENIDPFRSLVDPQTGVGGATYRSASLGTVTRNDPVTNDRLVQGLNTLTSTGFRGGAAAKTGTTVVAEWDDTMPLIGYRVLAGGQRLVAVSLFPASGTSATGNVQELWENAVRWTGEAGGPGT